MCVVENILLEVKAKNTKVGIYTLSHTHTTHPHHFDSFATLLFACILVLCLCAYSFSVGLFWLHQSKLSFPL